MEPLSQLQQKEIFVNSFFSDEVPKQLRDNCTEAYKLQFQKENPTDNPQRFFKFINDHARSDRTLKKFLKKFTSNLNSKSGQTSAATEHTILESENIKQTTEVMTQANFEVSSNPLRSQALGDFYFESVLRHKGDNKNTVYTKTKKDDFGLNWKISAVKGTDLLPKYPPSNLKCSYRGTGRTSGSSDYAVYQYLNTSVDDVSVEITKSMHQAIRRMKCGLIQKIMADMPHLDVSEVGDGRTSETIVIGRVRAEDEMPLDHASVLLEGCREGNRQNTCQVYLSNVKSYFLFEGQMVAMRGVCQVDGITAQFRPSEIYWKYVEPAPIIRQLDPNWTTFHRIFVLNGPLTPPDSFSLDNVDRICDYLKSQNPDTVILMGPILDANHQFVAFGDIRCALKDPDLKPETTPVVDFTDIYRLIFNRMSQVLSGTNIFVIPHVDDVLHPYPMPQPNFNPSMFWPNRPLAGNQMSWLPNPSIVTVGDLDILFCSHDLLSPIVEEAIATPNAKKLEEAFQQIITQKHLFPRSPSPLFLPLDPRHKLSLDPNTMPSIFVTPHKAGPSVQTSPDAPGFAAVLVDKHTAVKHRASATELIISPPHAEAKVEGLSNTISRLSVRSHTL